MKRIILSIIGLLFFCNLGLAQKYRTAAGIRLGTEIGLSVQQLIRDKTTLEAIFQTRVKTNEIKLTLLGERHYRLLGKRMNFYVGGGVHKGWNTRTEDDFGDPAGLTGVGGVELTLDRLNISWDFQPAVNVVGGDRVFVSQSAISLRYVFVKAKKKKFNWKFWKKKDSSKKRKRRWGRD
ncbi:MAG: hypothetical protein AAFV95_26805 [Bacteroidota bacterium]